MSYLTPLIPGFAYGLGKAEVDVQSGYMAKIADDDVFALADSTSGVFGVFLKDAKEEELATVYCCGGIYETDVFEGDIQAGDPLTTHASGKITKSENPDTEMLVGVAISVSDSVLKFKLII